MPTRTLIIPDLIIQFKNVSLSTRNFSDCFHFLLVLSYPASRTFFLAWLLAFVKTFVWLVSRVVGLNNFAEGSVKRNIGITTFLPEPFPKSNQCKVKIQLNFQISLGNILKSKRHHVKVLAMTFHMNDHNAGFRRPTQTLEPL